MLHRGGDYSRGTGAGIFAYNNVYVNTTTNVGVGFSCSVVGVTLMEFLTDFGL